jgi:hypothetical protein
VHAPQVLRHADARRRRAPAASNTAIPSLPLPVAHSSAGASRSASFRATMPSSGGGGGEDQVAGSAAASIRPLPAVQHPARVGGSAGAVRLHRWVNCGDGSGSGAMAVG